MYQTSQTGYAQSNQAYNASGANPAGENAYSRNDVQHQETRSAAFSADDFLDPFRPKTPFIGDAQTIQPYVEEAFRLLTGKELPGDVIIRVGSEAQLAAAYPGGWSPNIAGFALNRCGWGVSEIYCRHDNLDRLLLTVGHELGHVMSVPLKAIHDEEGKAFAFSLAWMKTIKDNNIAGIGHAINPAPAKNGLHDVAFNYVASLVEAGHNAIEIFARIATGVLRVPLR